MSDAQNALKYEIKRLIVDSCDKDVDPAAIGDEEALFGSQAPLALDSLDALQVSMALQKKYGVRLADSKETRRVFANVDSLARFLAETAALRR